MLSIYKHILIMQQIYSINYIITLAKSSDFVYNIKSFYIFSIKICFNLTFSTIIKKLIKLFVL